MGETEESGKVIRGLEKEYDAPLKYILSTHKHWDHVNGNEYWLQERPDVTIIGSDKEWEKIPGLKQENAMSDL